MCEWIFLLWHFWDDRCHGAFVKNHHSALLKRTLKSEPHNFLRSLHAADLSLPALSIVSLGVCKRRYGYRDDCSLTPVPVVLLFGKIRNSWELFMAWILFSFFKLKKIIDLKERKEIDFMFH